MMPPAALHATAPAEMAAPSGEDIVVLGERIRRFRFSIQQDKKSGALSCKIRRKSGDPKLDAALCDEAQACVAANPGHAKGVAPDLPAFQTCLEGRFETIRLARAAPQGAR